VVGDLPSDLAGASMKRVRASASQPLNPDEDVSERHGWCAIEDPMITDLDHDTASSSTSTSASASASIAGSSRSRC
jgi:hypothetical protein